VLGGTGHETADLRGALAINLVPCFTPVQSPESNGISESFVKTLKRDYVPRPIIALNALSCKAFPRKF
jgi:hypothetical protein